jgi:hypothetical protein
METEMQDGLERELNAGLAKDFPGTRLRHDPLRPSLLQRQAAEAALPLARLADVLARIDQLAAALERTEADAAEALEKVRKLV